MTTAEMIDVMQAFERGETIEVTRKGLDLWTLFNGNDPSWDWSFYEFRISPKPVPKKYRPFTADEFKPHRDRWLKTSGDRRGRVWSYGEDGLYISGIYASYTGSWERFLSEVVFDDDNTPCGVEVVE